MMAPLILKCLKIEFEVWRSCLILCSVLRYRGWDLLDSTLKTRLTFGGLLLGKGSMNLGFGGMNLRNYSKDIFALHPFKKTRRMNLCNYNKGR